MAQAPSMGFLLILSAVLSWDNVLVLGQTAPQGAEAFFSETEDAVKLLASSALANYRNRSELWNTCDTECSVFSCQPLRLNAQNSLCVALPTPTRLCQLNRTDDVGCSNVTISTRSYIRLPPAVTNPSKLTCDVQTAICAQRNLDQQAFPNIYANEKDPLNNYKVAASYFGASNGVFRGYPGLLRSPYLKQTTPSSFVELAPKDCSTFDPRKRPWYKAVTGVIKQVVILLDAGGPMATTLSLAEGISNIMLTAARSIITEFLDTLNMYDTVSVYGFHNSGATMIDKKVQVVGESSNGTEFSSLKASISGTTTTATAAKANLTAALESVLLHGGFENETDLIQSLKVILVITAGDLADGVSIDLPPSITQAASTMQVRTFIVRLNGSSQEEDAPRLADLQSVACSIGGTYDEIPLNIFLGDPLSTLGSFYGYVSALRLQLDKQRPLWVPSFEAIYPVGKVMVVAYPVFDGNFLAGVVAIDLLRDAIEETWPDAISNLRTPADSKHSHSSALNCSLSLFQKPLACSHDSSRRGLCLGSSFQFVDDRLTYAERTCCDDQCLRNRDNGNNKIAIIGGVIGGTAAVFTAVLLFYYFHRKIHPQCYVRSQSTPSAIPLVTPPEPVVFETSL
ncbi:hypothetical protein R1sor_025650 [Riccia sorocarpa]|uniref:VWFA domain-containing protein n=1 Tax=Riccia sorocarpa TaxID=122646 RepID=A0ABD3GAT1_9MARC